MADYVVGFTPSADKALRRLPKDVQRRIVAAVDELAQDPCARGSVKLEAKTISGASASVIIG